MSLYLNRKSNGIGIEPIRQISLYCVANHAAIGTFAKSNGLSHRQNRIDPHSSRFYGLLPISRRRPSRILPVSLFQTSSTFRTITTRPNDTSPAFTVLDGLQRPVLLRYLPRLGWARNRTAHILCRVCYWLFANKPFAFSLQLPLLPPSNAHFMSMRAT